jgi:hypothetical protein
MIEPIAEAPADPKDRAKAVVRSVAQRTEMQRDHGMMSRIVAPEVLDDAVDAAYRTQFDDDRTRFRQKIAALGEVILQQIPIQD